MALNNSRKSIIDNRKKEVARLRLMGFSQRQIADELEKAKITNPDTGKAFALGTINSDLKELQAEWRKLALEDTRSQRGRVLAEIQELRRRAWAKDDLPLVLRGLAQETSVAGLQRPPAPEDIIHYDTRYVEIESETSKYVRKLITAEHAPNATPEERATLKQKYADWFYYANMLLKRNEEGLEPLADNPEPDEEELEHPGDDHAQEQDDEQQVS